MAHPLEVTARPDEELLPALSTPHEPDPRFDADETRGWAADRPPVPGEVPNTGWFKRWLEAAGADPAIREEEGPLGEGMPESEEPAGGWTGSGDGSFLGVAMSWGSDCPEGRRDQVEAVLVGAEVGGWSSEEGRLVGMERGRIGSRSPEERDGEEEGRLVPRSDGGGSRRGD